jgi:hypothetical protein
MSTIKFSLRLTGDLPSTEKLNTLLQVSPTSARRPGEQISRRRAQPTDLWLLDLAAVGGDRNAEDMEEDLLEVANQLTQLAPALASIPRERCKADLYISILQTEDQGGLSLPPQFVLATAVAQLSIQVSILAMLNDCDDDSRLEQNANSTALAGAVPSKASSLSSTDVENQSHNMSSQAFT